MLVNKMPKRLLYREVTQRHHQLQSIFVEKASADKLYLIP